MNIEDLTPDCNYKLKVSYDGYPRGTLVVFKWMTTDEKHAVVHIEGQSDMNSMFVVSPDDLEID